MNFCDRISNQSNIYYSQGRYGRQLSYRHSSPDLRPAKKQTERRESTKSWVIRSFYSSKTNPTPALPIPDLPPAAARKIQDNLTKVSTDEVSSDRPKPAVYFEQRVIDSVAEKYKFCLVGKFPGWRPSLTQIKHWVSTRWKLHGRWSVTLLDHRHVFISLDNEADMLHVWGRNRWIVNGHLMKVFKWFPAFRPSEGEPASAAVWVSLPSLPLIFFEEELLFRIAALAGKVFAMDDATRSLSRANVARVCVEVDLLKELPRQVWIQVGNRGFWQDFLYEKLPFYCTVCRQQGHSSTQLCCISTSSHDISPAKLKPTLRNPSSEVATGGNSRSQFRNGKRVQIGPIVLEEDQKGSSPPNPSGHSSAELLDNSFQPGLQQKQKRVEETSTSTGSECCGTPVSQQLVPVNGLSERDRKGMDALGGGGESIGAFQSPSDGSRKAEDFPAAFDSLHPEKPSNRRSERRESFRPAPPTSAPRRRKRPMFFWQNKPKDIQEIISQPRRLSRVVEYKYSHIKKMTRSFSEKIGRGGFGSVYRGVLPDGQIVAVKVRSRTHSAQGDREFLSEIEIIPAISHLNVIRLLGFCSEGPNRALVYEFMPRGSLDRLIHPQTSSPYTGSPNSSLPLLEIALGVARGLDYLQSWCHAAIAHLDVKPSNILLDRDFRPRVSDFGLSKKMTEGSWSSGSISAVRGTPGYLAPELFTSTRISKKTDVYGYGVMLLEMALRKKPFDAVADDPSEVRLVYWVMNRVTPGGEIPGVTWEETERKMIMVGLSCTQVNPQNRPSFAKIIEMLEGSVDDLSVPSKSSMAMFLDPFSAIDGGAKCEGERPDKS